MSWGIFGGVMKRLLFVIALFLLWAAQLSAEELSVDLRFEPTAASTPAARIVADVKTFKGVRIHPFSDKRPVGETFLGELRRNGQLQPIRSEQAVAGYATDAFTLVYGEWGGKISPDGPLALKGEIIQFEFVENESYQAKIEVHFFLLDDRDRILWDGHSSGVVRGSGKVIGTENLSALFSDVLCATFTELMEDQKLAGVWSGRVSSTYLIKDDPSVSKPAR
jgi:hypothetical protein